MTSLFSKGWHRSARLITAAAASVAMLPGTAFAQTAPSDSAMVNLVRMLVEQGVLTKDKGDALMAQALAEADQAKAAQASAPVQQALSAPAVGTIRVPYVPETVRAQIKDELKAEVLAQAKAEGWASPEEAAPSWVKRVKISGDIRVRSQSALYSDNNSNLIPDFSRFNPIGPIPIFERNTFIPLLNTREDRINRLQLRARLGIDVDLGKNLAAGFQLASGQDNSPISTNASLGGGFGKRDLWLQQAYLRVRPTEWAKADFGRMPNPFFSTDLVFDDDLSFDGVAAELNGGQYIGEGIKAAVRGGAFPLDFGDANFPENDFDKQKVPERWLFAGQVELGAKFDNDVEVNLAGAYYSYKNIQGQLSDPCFIYQVQPEFRDTVICSTDNTQAQFLRKGNTVFPIRDIVVNDPPPALNEIRTSPQFIGLVYDYDLLNATARVRFPVSDKVKVTVTGDYVKNLSFKRNPCRLGAIQSEAYPPLNNVGAGGNGNVCSPTGGSPFVGGDTGYMVMAGIGTDTVRKWGDWRVRGGYKYLESDAVVDAFTDSNFHLGGTNAKGYILSAEAGLFDGLSFRTRWLSANEVSGEPLSIDVLQFDLLVAF